MLFDIVLKKEIKTFCSNALFTGNLASFSQDFSIETRLEKIAFVFARTSALFNLLTTYPYQEAYRWITIKFFSEKDLLYLFGPSVILKANPYHPRHIFSLIGFLMGLSSLLLLTYEKYTNGKTNPRLLSFAAFNTFSTRPFLHLANRIMLHESIPFVPTARNNIHKSLRLQAPMTFVRREFGRTDRS